MTLGNNELKFSIIHIAKASTPKWKKLNFSSSKGFLWILQNALPKKCDAVSKYFILVFITQVYYSVLFVNYIQIFNKRIVKCSKFIIKKSKNTQFPIIWFSAYFPFESLGVRVCCTSRRFIDTYSMFYSSFSDVQSNDLVLISTNYYLSFITSAMTKQRK